MKKDYAILTDSSCDLPQGIATELGIEVLPLSVRMDGQEYFNYLDGREIGFAEFYAKLREGKPAQTSAVNFEAFRAAMEAHLKQGEDVLYLGFSSGLSSTYNAGAAAAKELSAQYPERKVLVVDTLCASLGQGMFVYYVAQKQREGASIEEARAYAEERKLHLCHWFTVDDLNHLKRGGRISAATAAIGTVLNIKPVMHVDNDGHLVAVGKVRGRKASFKEIVNTMEETAENPAEQTMFISHGDCLAEAEYVAGLIKERLGVKEIILNYVGPVIGTHSGPGTIAVFFWGKER